ncbi:MULTISPECIES: hypothetical protein [unclassified Streptomyces]|uniref:Uncharacterized protein n=1 Tax=Streptomyces sp. NBC_00060 TaxID=2975636 RepID=A0AAU2H9S7_9ACTN
MTENSPPAALVRSYGRSAARSRGAESPPARHHLRVTDRGAYAWAGRDAMVRQAT